MRSCLILAPFPSECSRSAGRDCCAARPGRLPSARCASGLPGGAASPRPLRRPRGRTRGTLLAYTAFPVPHLRPLGHLSVNDDKRRGYRIRGRFASVFWMPFAA